MTKWNTNKEKHEHNIILKQNLKIFEVSTKKKKSEDEDFLNRNKIFDYKTKSSLLLFTHYKTLFFVCQPTSMPFVRFRFDR